MGSFNPQVVPNLYEFIYSVSFVVLLKWSNQKNVYYWP